MKHRKSVTLWPLSFEQAVEALIAPDSVYGQIGRAVWQMSQAKNEGGEKAELEIMKRWSNSWGFGEKMP